MENTPHNHNTQVRRRVKKLNSYRVVKIRWYDRGKKLETTSLLKPFTPFTPPITRTNQYRKSRIFIYLFTINSQYRSRLISVTEIDLWEKRCVGLVLYARYFSHNRIYSFPRKYPCLSRALFIIITLILISIPNWLPSSFILFLYKIK